MPAAVASRYARALADATLGPQAVLEPKRVVEELRGFGEALASSPELSIALTSPAISPARKRAVIDRIANALSLSRIPRNFLKVLVDHRRTGALDEIVDALEKLMDERLGILQVDVASARRLNDAQQAALVRELESSTGKKIWLKQSVDSDLIGGLVARIGSTVYDGSVRGKLEVLERRLRAE